MLIEIISPAPILNTSDFDFAFGGYNGNEIPLNSKKHPYCFEFVALKGMTFEVERVLKQTNGVLYQISTPSYPHPHLFIDSRFTHPTSSLRPTPSLPERETILQTMIEKIGTPYVWGGNWSRGIPEILSYYPPKGLIDNQTAILWALQGVDCSGLLFEATGGATPRNTGQLIHFGVPIKKEVPLQPLDMILYPGHVVFVLDKQKTIESKFPFGVITRDLSDRLEEFNAERTWVEEWEKALDPQKYYTARRFASHLFSKE